MTKFLSSIIIIFSLFLPIYSHAQSSVIDSYSETNVDNWRGLGGCCGVSEGQSITGNGETLQSVKFYLKEVSADISGSVSVKVYAHTGTFGTSSVPTGTALATSDSVDISAITSTPTLYTFPFTGVNRITLVNATKYVIAISYTGAGQLGVGIDASSPSHGGNDSQEAPATTWTAYNGSDNAFYAYQLDEISDPATTSYASGSYYDLDITQNTFYHAIILMFFSFLFPVWYFNKKRNDSLIQLKKK